MRSQTRMAGCMAWLVVALSAIPAAAAGKSAPSTKLTVDESARTVGLFEAQDEGLVTIKVAPADEKQANVIITNTTDAPLTVDVPKCVAAVHAVRQLPPAQPEPGSARSTYPADNTQPNQAQTVAGHLFGIGPPQGPEDGSHASRFTIPARKAVRVRLESVCLNLGKPTPSARMTYRLMRLADYTGDAALVRLFESVDLRRTDRGTLQAAAWNIANGVPFEKLATQTEGNGSPRPMFTPAQLVSARDLADDARKSADAAGPKRGMP